MNAIKFTAWTGTLLQQRRKELGLNQKALGELYGLKRPQQTVSDWERDDYKFPLYHCLGLDNLFKQLAASGKAV